jgi:hypothetical protein
MDLHTSYIATAPSPHPSNKMWDIGARRLVEINVSMYHNANFFRDKLSENKMTLWYRV